MIRLATGRPRGGNQCPSGAWAKIAFPSWSLGTRDKNHSGHVVRSAHLQPCQRWHRLSSLGPDSRGQTDRHFIIASAGWLAPISGYEPDEPHGFFPFPLCPFTLLIAPGVGLVVLLHQVVQVEVRVAPGGGDGGVAQEFLDGPEVRLDPPTGGWRSCGAGRGGSGPGRGPQSRTHLATTRATPRVDRRRPRELTNRAVSPSV